jgi:hypothetical protein
VVPDVLTRAQDVLARAGGYELHDGPRLALIGSDRQTGQCTLERAGEFDGAQGLDGTDEGLGLDMV